jgi:hypothetical protein
MLVGVGSVVLVAVGLGLFTWILLRRGGYEGLREGLPLVVGLAVALVAAAIVVPLLIQTPGTRRFVAGGLAGTSAIWSGWIALKAREAGAQRWFELALWVLAAVLAVVAVMSVALL